MAKKKSIPITDPDITPAELLATVHQLAVKVSDLGNIIHTQTGTISDLQNQLTTKVNSNSQATMNRSQLNLVSELQYNIISDSSGLSITEKDRPLFVINRNGSLGMGLKTAKTQGVGSLHIRANYPSEASIPSTGLNSTRGLLVESDADDNKSYAFRVVSRQNRQGLNVTGDGSVWVGIMNDTADSKVCVYQPKNDKNIMTLAAASKHYSATMLEMRSAGMNNTQGNFLEFKNQCSDSSEHRVFSVAGNGSTYTDSGYQSNQTGYAEYFEWEDVVKRGEDRTGIAVTLTKSGKIRPATDGDNVLGVVSNTAAIVGDAAWNNWHGKYNKTRLGNRQTTKYQILEWTNHNNILESYINSSLPGSYPVPDNAINYETDAQGQDMYSDQISSEYNSTHPYTTRENRNWAVVTLLGRTTMYKGQVTGTTWIKICDVSDETECWIIK